MFVCDRCFLQCHVCGCKRRNQGENYTLDDCSGICGDGEVYFIKSKNLSRLVFQRMEKTAAWFYVRVDTVTPWYLKLWSVETFPSAGLALDRTNRNTDNPESIFWILFCFVVTLQVLGRNAGEQESKPVLPGELPGG